jgi:hypothetical protein
MAFQEAVYPRNRANRLLGLVIVRGGPENVFMKAVSLASFQAIPLSRQVIQAPLSL